jgi:hypothetical protein
MSRFLAIGLLVACSHNEPKAATPVPPAPALQSSTRAEPEDPAPCEAVAAAILKTKSDSIDADKVRGVILSHCRDDQWSVNARKCVVTADTDTGPGACWSKFTDAQNAAFVKDMKDHGVTVEHPPRDSAAK